METKKAAPKGGLNQTLAGADYTPVFPPVLDSVIAEVLACLLDGQTITQRESYEHFSTVNIARTIHDLRHFYGWPVITTPEESPTRDGRIARYARYSLASDVIARHTDPQYICDVYAARKARRAS